MGADNDIVERLPLWKTGPVLREHPGYFLVHERDIDEAAAEIVRLRGEVKFHQLDAGALRVQLDSCIERLEVQTKNALHLHAMMVDAENRAATIAPAEAKDPAPAMPNGVEEMHDDLSTPDLLNEAERIAVNQYKDGRYAAARILRILCHRLRAADNRDAAGVATIRAEEYTRGRCDGWEAARSTPAAVPAGEAVAWLASDGEVFTDKESADRHSKVWGVNPLLTPLYTTPPAPVQAAPQEGECTSCETEGVFATDGSGPFDCYACGKKAAHPSACELGAWNDAIEAAASEAEHWQARSGSTHKCGDYIAGAIRSMKRTALQHRGDSRGGEG